MITTSQMACIVNAPAQQSATVTQTSSPTVSNNGSSTRISSAMDSSRNSGGNAHGNSKYMVFTHVKHTAQTFGNRIKNSFAAKGARLNPAATGGRVPQAQTGTINGNSKGKGGKGVPGYDNVGKGPSVNLPGSINNNGLKSVPGFENADNGPSVNLPGSQKKGSAADAANFMAGQENADVAALLNNAAQGPSVNLPSQSSAAQEQADGLLNGIVIFFAGGGSSAPTDVKGNEAGARTAARATTPNANGEGKGQGGASADQHTVVTSENLNGQYKDSSGGAIMTEGYMLRDAFTGEITGGSMSIVGPITITKSKKMPGDDSTGPVDARDGLAINNPFSARNNGGGTDNNVDQAGAGAGDIAPNSSYAQKENGDGSNDAGENYTASSGALAPSSSLTKKNQGDGGNADNCGGGNSSTLGKIKVNGSPTNGQLAAQTSCGRKVAYR